MGVQMIAVVLSELLYRGVVFCWEPNALLRFLSKGLEGNRELGRETGRCST